MEITYQLAEEDFRNGLRVWQTRNTWRKWNYRISFGLMVSLFGLGLILLIWNPSLEVRYFSWFLVGLPLVWFLSLWTAPRIQARLQYRRNPSAQSSITVTVSDSGLHSRSQYSDSRVAWSAYIGWAEGETVFVLFPQPRIYLPIPKRAFNAQELEEFRRILKRNVGCKDKTVAEQISR